MTAQKEMPELVELLEQLRQNPPDQNAMEVLADTLEQLRWVGGLGVHAPVLRDKHPVEELDELPAGARVGCPGVGGAFTHMACEKMFPQGEIQFYEEFADVVVALVEGKVEFAVLPVENSSAGQVGEVLELVSGNSLYINQTTDIKVEHCLCVHPDTDPATVTSALSHPQALAQCKGFLAKRGLSPQRYSNTATAAKRVGEQPGPVACICSLRGAQLYGLRILHQGIQDFDENYTRFICVSRRNILLPGADTVSISLSTPHEPGHLHRILTRFAACSLDLTRLFSMPIASRDFNVQFYLDFRGSIRDMRVEQLLAALYDELPHFQYLGNFCWLK